MQKLTRIKKLTSPTSGDNLFLDWDKLVCEITRDPPKTEEEAAVLSPSSNNVRWCLRASDRCPGLADKQLSESQRLEIAEGLLVFDEEKMENDASNLT